LRRWLQSSSSSIPDGIPDIPDVAADEDVVMAAAAIEDRCSDRRRAKLDCGLCLMAVLGELYPRLFGGKGAKPSMASDPLRDDDAAVFLPP